MDRDTAKDERKVDLVFSLNEGRLTYIAAIAAELAKMASATGEVRLARLLDDAAREAVLRAKMNAA